MAKDLQDSELYEGCYRFKERRSNLRFFAILSAILLLFFGVRAYWTNNFGGVKVSGPSMYKTLHDTDEFLMRYAPKGEGVERGDIIVVDISSYAEIIADNAGKPESSKLKYVIKRLIAVEGDEIKCEKGQVYIRYAGAEEFQALDEPYAYYRTQREKEEYHFGPYVVPTGQIFFLGDNRCNSTDSRYDRPNGSHLEGRMYEKKDIVGVVPSWAIEHQWILEKIFF